MEQTQPDLSSVVREQPARRAATPPNGKELKGIVNPRLVRVISFVVITVSLVLCTTLCIWAIWFSSDNATIWKAIATFFVVMVSTAIFTVVNEKLG